MADGLPVSYRQIRGKAEGRDEISEFEGSLISVVSRGCVLEVFRAISKAEGKQL